VLEPVPEGAVVGDLGVAEDIEQERCDVVEGGRQELEQLKLLKSLGL
jgi:hypothetical protein